MDGKTYQRWKILSAGFLVFIYMPVFLAIDEVSQIVFRGNANHTLTVISLLIVSLFRYLSLMLQTATFWMDIRTGICHGLCFQ